MRYAFLIYRDEKNFVDVPAEETERRMRGMQEILTETGKNGTLSAAVRLEDTTESRTARHQRGSVVISDGPFAETKEFLAGLLVINCESEAEAANWATRLTQVSCAGTVEYRRVAGVYPMVEDPEPVLPASCL
jgi:hypothetical protein